MAETLIWQKYPIQTDIYWEVVVPKYKSTSPLWDSQRKEEILQGRKKKILAFTSISWTLPSVIGFQNFHHTDGVCTVPWGMWNYWRGNSCRPIMQSLRSHKIDFDSLNYWSEDNNCRHIDICWRYSKSLDKRMHSRAFSSLEMRVDVKAYPSQCCTVSIHTLNCIDGPVSQCECCAISDVHNIIIRLSCWWD